MMDKKAYALSLLKEGCTCVLVGDKETLTSTRRGVTPLLSWLEEGKSCEGLFAVDKVVGKAAAFLYILLKTEGVHALVLSEGAEEVFLRFGMPYSFDVRVPTIRNRAGDGFCPMEQAVLGIEDPLEALKSIRIRLAQLQEGIK